MDKLQPLIRNRFWILSGLALPLILYGFYSANSQLRAAISSREAEIKTKFQAIPKGNEPNENFVQKLGEVNGFLEEAVDDAIVELWKNQQKRMVWPPSVANNIPKELMGRFDAQIPAIYRSKFDEEFSRLMLRVQPVKPMYEQPNVPASMLNLTNQKVWLAADLPQPTFNEFAITSQDVWDAQIDVWLTQVLLDAIVRTNTDAQSINEAVVRRLDRLELTGGSGEPTTSDSAGDMGGEMGSGMMMPGMGSGMMGGAGQKKFLTGSRGGMGSGMSMAGSPMTGGGMGRGMMGGGAGGDPMSVPFDPAQELGPSGDAAGGMYGSMSMGAGSAMMMGLEGGGEEAEPPSRYIGEDEETALFYQRGYYMSVIVKQGKVADFVAELLNSDWPVQVKRFHVGRNPYRQAQSSGFSNYSSGGMAGEFSLGSDPLSLGGSEASMMGGGPLSSNLGSMMRPGGASGMSAGGSGSSMFGGMGGAGAKTVRLNPYQQGLPARATDALNDPDLVQLDLVGIISMYKQPVEVMEAIKARETAREGQTLPVEDDPIMESMSPETSVDGVEETPEVTEEIEGLDFDLSGDAEAVPVDPAMPVEVEDLGFDQDSPVEFDDSIPGLDAVEESGGNMPASPTEPAGVSGEQTETEEIQFE